jgi:hypothetical protein
MAAIGFEAPVRVLCVNKNVNAHLLALLLIFGFGHPSREPLDAAKGIQLHSRIPCDGFGGPEEAVHVQVTFSTGATPRELMVGRHLVEKCEVESMFQCWHKPRAGWHDVWSALSSAPDAKPSSSAIVPIASCNEWGSKEPAQYILSGWYQEHADSKPFWRQAALKQVSTQPEIYEFTDPAGGTGSIQIGR